MPNQIQPYVDGWLGNERESSVIPTPQFPFSKYPTADLYSRVYERMFYVCPRLFLPKVARRTSWTNLLTYSEQFDNAAWTKTNLTPTADAGTAPDGQTTLDKVLETVTNAEHSVAQAATAAASTTEASVFAVGGLTRLWIRVAFTDSAATTFSGFFNIASGYVGTLSAGVTAKIVGLGNSQFRCVIRFTPAAGAGTFKVNVSTDGSTISYAGNTANGVYLWGAQVATGTDSPYISTTSATRTVSAPDRDATDPMAYLVSENDPTISTSENAVVLRRFARVPLQHILPSSYLFSAPNYTPVNWSSAFTTIPGGSYAIAGNYAIVALASFTPSVNALTTAACAAISGYFDVALAITSFTGSPATVLTIPGHNYVASDHIVYRRDDGTGPRFYSFVVSSISGNDVNGASTQRAAVSSVGAAVALYLLTLPFPTDSTARKRTKTTPDTGQQVVLPAQVIEDYYLPGVTAGITTFSDIPSQQPFTLESYLAAWAAASTWFNVQSSGLDRWNDGPIIKRLYTQAKLNP